MKVEDRVREEIASKIIVACDYSSEYPCPHAYPTIGYEKCPHLDEDVCMWQREQARQILSIKGLLIKADDQSISEKVLDEINETAERYALRPNYAGELIGKILLKDNWVKVKGGK